MKKYAKIIDEQTKKCAVSIGTNVAFYKKIGMKLAEVEQNDAGEWILIEWIPEPEPPEPEEQEQTEEEQANEEQNEENTPLSDY